MVLSSTREAFTVTAASRRGGDLTSRVINEHDREDITIRCNAARFPVLQREQGRPSLRAPRARRGQKIAPGGDAERDGSASC